VFSVDISIRDFHGQAVVALRGQLSLADTPGVASRLITTVTDSGPSVIVDLTGLDGIGYTGLSVLLRLTRLSRFLGRRGGVITCRLGVLRRVRGSGRFPAQACR
jgi:anti-anti-sigma regulatory factor